MGRGLERWEGDWRGGKGTREVGRGLEGWEGD